MTSQIEQLDVLTKQLDVLTKQLDVLTKQLETVNCEYSQLYNACAQKEKEKAHLLEDINQIKEKIKLATKQMEVEQEQSHKTTFVMYGEGLLERVLGPSDRYDEEEDEEKKEIILPPLDKKLFPALVALQEKHPIILKRGPQCGNTISNFWSITN